MKSSNGNLTENLSTIHKDLSSGLLYTHSRINANTNKPLEAASFLYVLIELLNEKGLLTIEELDERKKQVAGRLVKRFVDSGLGFMYQDPEYDKYAFDQEADIDCESRLDTCKAVCCKLPFALSKQDVEEGIIRWEFCLPYLIAHGDDGYCVLWTGIPISAQLGITEPYHVGVLTAGIIKPGMSGMTTKRRFTILNWKNGSLGITLKSTLPVCQISQND